MDIDSLTDDDLDELASQLAGRLPTGRYGGQFVLSRRQLLTLAGGSAGVAGLVALGVDPATAQSAAGQVGTQSSPEDVFAYDLDVQGALQRDLDAGGQAISNVGSVSTGSLVIGGTLFEEDDNSPINVLSTDSVTYSVAGDYDQLIILGGSGEGFNQLRVNGDSGQNYDYLDNADNQTQGVSEWEIPRVFERDYLSIHDIRGSQIEISTPLASRKPGQTVAGDNSNVSGPITQFTLSDSGGANRDLTARVFGREI